jgi:glycerophosphoryl diester phosphodiesterase
VSELPALRRVGHKGADHIAPGNTVASFDAAVAAGVDMIEFDILPEDLHRPADSRLVLAHDYTDDLATALTLEEGLAHLATTDVELDVDLKLPGYEARVVEALRAHGLVERALVSTTFMRSLVAIRALEPQLRLGWSVPRARRDYTASWRYKLLAYAAIARIRRRLPEAARGHLAAGRCDALMAHWRLVSPRLVRAVADAGGELYVWTVDDGKRIRRLEQLGVTGVITNDPRLFVMDS